jgi:hypothetical protein
MPDAFKKLAQAELAQAPSTTTLYTVPAGVQAIIKHMKAVNSTAGAVTVKMWHDGTADVNLILPEVTLQAGEWGEWDGTMVMEAGDTLAGQSDSATAVTVTVYGDEVT